MGKEFLYICLPVYEVNKNSILLLTLKFYYYEQSSIN